MTTFTGTLIVCGLVVSLGIMIQHWLFEAGFARDRSTFVIAVMLGAILIKEIAFPFFSWTIFAPALVMFVVLVVNLPDLWVTKTKGRWWWE